MSRAANRRDAGFVQAKRGTRVGSESRDTRAPQAGSKTRRTALLKFLDRQPEGQRDALLAELDGRDTPQARALAAELRERWEK
jgi:hypothetical protein